MQYKQGIEMVYNITVMGNIVKKKKKIALYNYIFFVDAKAWKNIHGEGDDSQHAMAWKSTS